MKKISVFISYQHENKDWVHLLATKLLEENFSIWLDEWSIPAGADWAEEMHKGLPQME